MAEVPPTWPGTSTVLNHRNLNQQLGRPGQIGD